LLAAIGGTAASAIAGINVAMSEIAPETAVYVSNAGDPSIHVLAMDRASGDLQLIDQVAIPDLQPSPTSMPLALTPDGRFLHAALRSEPEQSGAYLQLAMAYGRKGDIPHADLASAQAAFARGDVKTAKQLAERAKHGLPVGSPAWVRADDIVNVKMPKPQ